MNPTPRPLGGRRRGLALFAALLALQGPLAGGHGVAAAALLALVAVPVVLVVHRALSAGWCSSADPLRAICACTAVMFAAQEVYSGVGVEWINRTEGTTLPPDLGRIAMQHLLALALAAAVALVAVGARLASRCARAIVRLAVASPVVATPLRLLITALDVLRGPSVIAHQCGMRSPPRCALPC
ncbi:hypothetical protein [Nocardioides sp. YIM 152588]|uniref:hypothetical protein n=1 Tax=Nocardioides sp. YIM 152588 TaxID=3158259 RepID=UPI0032E4B072